MSVAAETEILSLEERTSTVLKKAFSFAYEDNPARTEWPLHSIDADFQITCPEDQKGEAYYMAELYLETADFDELIGITESLPAFLDIYLSGRCSIQAKLDTYTPERLEQMVEHAEQVVMRIEQLRESFKARQT